MDDGTSCTAVWMHLAPLSYVLNMVKIVCFVLCDSYHIKKKIVYTI